MIHTGTRVRALLATGAVGLVASTALAGAQAASAVTPGAVVRVSGPSPYARCVTPAPATSVLNRAQEVEPFVAADPMSARHLVGVWQQDRWSDGGANGLVAGVSRNGGGSWVRSTLPFSHCAAHGLNYERASDPWVSIGPDGTVYAVGLSFDLTGNQRNAIGAAVSHDGGLTWVHTQAIVRGVGGNLDKESVTADPKKPGVAYATWDSFDLPTEFPYRIPGYFSRTSDFGKTWSKPVPIVARGLDQQSIGNIILVNPHNGNLYDVYGFYPNTAPQIRIATSTDGGTTWGRDHAVAALDFGGVNDPRNGQPLRVGDGLPAATINAATGRLYIAWQSRRFSAGKYDEIALTTSTNGGGGWSTPVRVNTPTAGAAFNPSIAVNAAGVVAVGYYDFRRFTASNHSNLPTDIWLRTSRNGGRTFGPDQHVDGPFNFRAAAHTDGGFFLGDYQGMTTIGQNFVPFYAKTNCLTMCPANGSDIYATVVPPLAFTAAGKAAPESPVAAQASPGSSHAGVRRSTR